MPMMPLVVSRKAWREWVGLRPEGALPVHRWRRSTAVVISLVAFVVTLYLVIGVVINLGYPLRPDSKATDWGGPSLMGRWLVHGAGGVLFAVAIPFVSRGLAALARRILTGGQPAYGRSPDAGRTRREG